MNKRKEGAPLVKGGQGRSDDDLYADAIWFFILAGALLAPIAIHLIWRAGQWLNG